MMGHNLCFKGVIWEIIPKLSLLPPLSEALKVILYISMLENVKKKSSFYDFLRYFPLYFGLLSQITVINSAHCWQVIVCLR